MATSYTDKPLTTPAQVGSDLVEYPFASLGDVATRLITRRYWVRPASWVPSELGVDATKITVASVDYYLIAESQPTTTGTGLFAFTRRYAPVPPAQVEYSTIAINKPAFPAADFEGYWVDNVSSSGTVNVWSIAQAATVTRYPTGGTFTITYKASTTGAIAYDAAAATIETEIDALADVLSDGFTTNVSNQIASSGFFSISLAAGASFSGVNFSIDVGSLTAASIWSVSIAGSDSFSARIALTSLNFNKPAHGLSAAQAIRMTTIPTGGGTETTVATVVDVDNFTVANSDTTPNAWTHYRPYIRTYTPGPDRIRTRLTTTYYLPGVSIGITTPADIPIPDVATNDNTLLLLICENATGFEIYDAESLTRWLDGPIYQQTLIATDMANF